LPGFATAALRSATPLLWALLGETVVQRAGIVNLGTEGQMLVGAAAAFGITAHTGGPWLGLAGGALAGCALSAVHALLCVRYGGNQFASGLAVWLLGFGISGYVGAGFVGQSIEGFAPLSGSWLARVPVARDLTPTVLLSFAAVIFCWVLVYRTRPGLTLRAVGESVAAARIAGLRASWVQACCIALGGLLSGVGGAALSIDYAQTWAEGMTKGRGLVAVGLVIVARWNPLLALPAALLFGASEALSLRLQSAGVTVSQHLLHMLPYVTSLVVFVAICRRHGTTSGAPAGLRAVLDG
jgi:ABC-type uncharacterized transport system permease subunit